MVATEALRRRRDDVLRVCERPGTAEDLFVDLAATLRHVVPFSATTCFGLDPATMLATSPAVIQNVDRSQCEPFWPREFLVEDTNLFLDLVRTHTPAAGLVQGTDHRPARSARYREFMAPQGFGDELRAVLRADRSAWGSLSFYRDAQEPPFSPAEIEFVAGLTRPLAEALRARMVAQQSGTWPDPDGPGLLVFDRTATLLNANQAAAAWLEELPNLMMGPKRVPSPILVLIAHALAVSEGRERGTPRMRLRGAHGRWLVLHASPLAGAGGTADLVGVVVEPAASSEIAPIIVEAYALTAREQQIISGLARGLGTADIAQGLFLSAHTVRDHVKSIFGKLGVSTRGELVAKLFADHYAPALEGKG